MGNLQWVGIFEATIGEVLVSKHRPDEAEPHAVRAQEVTAAIGDEHMLAIAEHTLADIAFERRQWKQALERYERALGIDRALGMKENAVHVLDRKSRVLEQLGRTTEALVDGREAMELQKSYLNEGNMIAVARFEEQAAAARQQLADSLRARQLLAERDQRTIAELSASRNRTAAWGSVASPCLRCAVAPSPGARNADATMPRPHRPLPGPMSARPRRSARPPNSRTPPCGAQMDEHFISNTLNAVNAHLYTDDPDAASTLLQRFAQWIAPCWRPASTPPSP
ncbi:MAG: tetratricopeptide repeat protein [Flavobacteriales bacterium]|nr:tetratricopeptide repeat protein [Flavobacteriales bacterium]